MTKLMPNTVRFYLSRQKISASLKTCLEKMCFAGKFLNYQLATKSRGWSEAVNIGISGLLNGLVRSVPQSGCCWKGPLQIISTLTKHTVIFKGFSFHKQNILWGRKNCSTATIKACWSYGNSKKKEALLSSFTSPPVFYPYQEIFKAAFGTSKLKKRQYKLWGQIFLFFLALLIWVSLLEEFSVFH